MREDIMITGIVLKAFPVGEYDRGIVILTKERGKISAFARGCRKPGNKLCAVTNPFSFGTFKLYEGKNSYTLIDADIHTYFEELRTDYVGACYGMYFTELAEYYTRENNDEKEMLKLLYQSLRALISPALDNRLVKCVFECKALAVNGEFPGIPKDRILQESTVYAITYIAESSIEKLYTFTVTDSVLSELEQVAEKYRDSILGHRFKSLEVLESLY